MLGAGKPRIEGPDGQIKWQFEGEEYDMYQREHDVLFASIRDGKPKNDDLNLAPSTLLAIMSVVSERLVCTPNVPVTVEGDEPG